MVRIFDKLKHLSFYRSFIQASHLVSAQFFIQILGILSFIVYTHLFPPEEFGIVSLFYSFASILLSISTLHIYDTVYRYYYEEDGDFRKYITSAFIMVVFVFVFISTIIFLFREWIFGGLIKNFPEQLLLPLFLYSFSTFLYVITGNVLMAKRLTKHAAISNVLYNYSKFGIGVLFVLIAFSPKISFSRIWGETVATSLLGIVFLLYLAKTADFNISQKVFNSNRKYAQKLGFPFLFLGLSDMILGAFDQWFINNHFGNYETGIYSFGYKIGALLAGVSQAFLQGNGNDYYENMNAGHKEKIAVQSKTLLKFIALAAIGLMFFSNDIVVLFARREAYHEAIPIVSVVVLGYFFHALFNIYARNFLYAKKAGILSILMISTGVINIFLNIIFLPKYGYQVAAHTTMVSYLIMAIAIIYADKKLLGYDNIHIKMLLPIIIICIGCFVGAFYMSSWWGWGPFFLKGAIFIAVFAILFADRIREFLSGRTTA